MAKGSVPGHIKRTETHLPRSRAFEDVTDPYLDGSYKHRNVFKSIIRHMHSCITNRKGEYMGVLEEKGYAKPTIERAFNRVSALKRNERKSGKKTAGMRMIKLATQERSVYTYILKDALHAMRTSWSLKGLGRIAQRNMQTYQEMCTQYSQSIDKLLKDEP